MKKISGLSAEKVLTLLINDDVVLGTKEDLEIARMEKGGCQMIDDDDPDNPLGFVCSGKCSGQFKRCTAVITVDDGGEIIAFCSCRQR